MNSLDFDSVKEALHRSIIKADSLQLIDGVIFAGKGLAVFVGSGSGPVLGAASDGHVERLEGNGSMQGLAHAAADDLASMHVDQCRKKEPAFAGLDIGQIGKPDLVWRGRRKVPPQSVWCYRIIVTTIGRTYSARDCGQSAQARNAHEARDTMARDASPDDSQSCMDAWCAITAAALCVSVANVAERVWFSMLRRPPQLRILGCQVSRGRALRWRDGAPLPVPALPNCLLQRRSCVSGSPSSAATSAIDNPLVSTRSAACRLNLSGKYRRFFLSIGHSFR